MADVVAAARGVVVVGGVVLGASAVEASSVVVAAAPPKRKRLRSWAKALGVEVAAVAALSVTTPEALVAVSPLVCSPAHSLQAKRPHEVAVLGDQSTQLGEGEDFTSGGPFVVVVVAVI
jgi:hypothetical protein